MKKTKIEVLCQVSTMQALIVPQEMPLEEAVEMFARDHSRHGIFLIDRNNRLAGVINNHDLLDWARVQFDVSPKNLPLPVGKVRRLLLAKTVADLAMPDSQDMSVRLDDSLESALRKMAHYELEDIAVIDDSGQIVNDLRLSEVLLFALRVTASQRA